MIPTLFRSARTPTGVLLLLAAVAAVLAVSGSVYPEALGGTAVVLALVAILQRFSRLQDAVGQISELRARSSLQDQAIATLSDEAAVAAEAFEALALDLDRDLTEVSERIEALGLDLGRTRESLDSALSEIDSVSPRFAAQDAELRQLRTKIDGSTDFARHAARQLRSIVDDLESRVPNSDRTEVAAEVDDPVLSIAIPSFNRPDDLRQCLESIVAAVERADTHRVEVWITDDCSVIDAAPRLAREFALAHSYMGFRWLPENVGLEANLIECARRCRGEYLWVLGCDDLVAPEGFPRMLEDVEAGLSDVLVYDKERIDSSGVELQNRVAGSRPEGLQQDEQLRVGSPLEYAELTGVLSGLGFISTVVVRRAPFLDVDPGPYMNLTLFPQVAIVFEAFTESDVVYRNSPLVMHRTRTPQEKLGEAVGRREEGFMAGGQSRDGRYHGAALAAMLQRVCDRSTLEPEDFVHVPERLLRESSLLDWIRKNMARAAKAGLVLDPSVTVDAERFLSVAEAARARSGQIVDQAPDNS
ncbi:MAG: glycosyltransferase family 2 protein [Acidimicrobiaceae bacterium]|nr:glycosyltransferase family 2 protein [Acidimicrobiaceae bacterium]